MGETLDGDEQNTLDQLGEGAGSRISGGEGGGGADGAESFTLGGPRGRDAEAGDYLGTDADDLGRDGD